MDSRRNKAGDRSEPVGSVSKALEVLRAFVDGQDQWGVRELAPVLDLPRSTVHRMLVRLRLDGFLDYDETRKKYQIGFEFFRLAAAAYRRNEQMQAVAPLLREMAGISTEGIWFALYDPVRHRVAYVAEEASSRLVRPTAPIGQEEGLIDSAFGLAVLAALDVPSRRTVLAAMARSVPEDLDARLDSIRRQGYAVMRQPDVDAQVIAACVRGPNDSVLGSIGIVVPMHRHEPKREPALGELVVAAGRRLAYRLNTRFLGGSSSGTWHDAVSIISEMLQRQDPDFAVVPVLGGGSRNLEDLDRGLGSYALTTAASLYDAVQGRGRFERKLSGLRAIMKLSEMHLHIVTKQGIRLTNVGDFAGLRVCPGEEGYASAHTFEDLLKAGRVSKARIEREGALLYMDLPEAKRQFKSGAIDAMVWLAVSGSLLAKDIESERRSVLHGLPEPLLRRLTDDNPGYHLGAIEPQQYPLWLKEPVRTLVDATVLVCTRDCADDEVYEIAQTIFEGREQLALISPAYRHLDRDFAVSGLTAPMHAGATRFFEKQAGAQPSPPRGDRKRRPAMP